MFKKILSLTLAICVLLSVVSFAVFAEDTGEIATPILKKIKVACVGDSITYGANLPNRETQCYPVLLQELLGERYDVENFGISAYCVLKNSKRPYWDTEQYKASLDFKADIVIIMLGTNDIKTENWEAVERNNYVAGKDYFVSDYCDLIETYKTANPEAEIYVCTPPPIYLEESNAERPPLNLENYGVPLIREVAKKTNSTLIDIFPILDNKAELFEDKLHPNPVGAKIIANEVYNSIAKNSANPAEFWLKNLENIPGFTDPEGELTREEFAYLIANIFSLENNPKVISPFIDTADSAYKEEIRIAYANGIIKGISSIQFNPSGKITRQEITLMLYRLWQILYPEKSFAVENTYSFSDEAEISDWAKEAVLYMYDRKIMLGTSTEIPTISPLNNIRRDHSLLLMERIINFCIENK